MAVVPVPTQSYGGVALKRTTHGSGAVHTGGSHGMGVEPPVRDERRCDADGKTCQAWKKKGEKFCQGHIAKMAKDAE